GALKVDTVKVTAVEVCDVPGSCPETPVDATDTSIVGTVVRPPPAISVDKTNDADGDGSFNDSETAPASGAPVIFQAIITNTGGTSLTLTDLTDEYPGVGPTVVCNLIGTTLLPGQSVTCTFTVTGYAPAPGDLKVNLVSVTAVEVCEVSGSCPERSVGAH